MGLLRLRQRRADPTCDRGGGLPDDAPRMAIVRTVYVSLRRMPRCRLELNDYVHRSPMPPLFRQEDEGWEGYAIGYDGEFYTVQDYEDYGVEVGFKVVDGAVVVERAVLRTRRGSTCRLSDEEVAQFFRARTVEREVPACDLTVTLLWRRGRKTWLARVEDGEYVFLRHVDFTPTSRVKYWGRDNYEGYRDYRIECDGEYVAHQPLNEHSDLRIRFAIRGGRIEVLDSGGLTEEDVLRLLLRRT